MIGGVQRPNVFSASFEYDDEDPDGYRCGAAMVGAAAGGSELIVKLFEMPAGQDLCPYHYEYVEEWLLVVSGEVSVRGPDGVTSLAAGDLVCFPPGPAGSHKVLNPGAETARIMMWSSSPQSAVAVYPDSDKVGVWVGEERLMVRRADGNVPYYDGEA